MEEETFYFQRLLIAEEHLPYYRAHPEELFDKVYYFFSRDLGKETPEGLVDLLSN